MKIKTVDLETVCGITSILPENDLPEFAFSGRSNVGKSSLINVLMNRKSFARISAEPGKTRTINYYNINKAFYFVDLPGYGYAKVSKSEREKWGRLIEKYLYESEVLKEVFLLVDIRHEPTENDKLMFDWIKHTGYDPVVIATKLDKIKRSQIQKQLSLIRKSLDMDKKETIIPFSSKEKTGRDDVFEIIEKYL